MRRRTAATSGTSGRRAAARQPPRSTAEAVEAAAAVRIQAFYRGRLGRVLAARWRQRKQQETLEEEQRKRAERRKQEAFCEVGGLVFFFSVGAKNQMLRARTTMTLMKLTLPWYVLACPF